MNKYAQILAAMAVLPTATCMSAPPVQPAAAECDMIESRDWRAWVNAMPGPSMRPTLIVTGTVTLPSGGWDFIWRTRVMESYPVQVAFDLEPLIAEGATQAVTTRELRHELAIDPPVGSVTLRCGSKVLARIAPVETAH